MVSIRCLGLLTAREADVTNGASGGIAAEHGDVLICEQRRPDGPSRTVGPRERAAAPASAAARVGEPQHFERKAREEALLDPPAHAPRHRSKAAPGEEAQMRRIEDAAAVVVEAPQPDTKSRIPVSDVRHARD